MTVEEVIDFLKKQDLETVTGIWMDIMEEIKERWDKTKEIPADMQELEKMMKAAPAVGYGRAKIQPVITGPSFFKYISSQAHFGFPPQEEELASGKVYVKDQIRNRVTVIEGGVSCGGDGLTVIQNEKAVSLKYEDIERIEWRKKEVD